MPREDVFDSSGNAIDGIPTEQEVQDLNTKVEEASKVTESFDKVKETLELEEGQTVEDKLSQMKEEKNPNWSAARKKIDNLTKVASDNGFKVDDDGNVIKDESITKDDISKQIQDGVKQGTFNNKKEEILSKYTAEDGKMVEFYLDKLIAGEELTVANLNKFAAIAHISAFPTSKAQRRAPVSNGGEPNFGNEAHKAGSVDSELAKNFGITEEDKKKYNIT